MQESGIEFVEPKAGTTALLKFDLEMSSRDFCVDLLQATGVMLTPGSALSMEGYLRLGFANHQDVLREGLKRMSSWLAEKRA